MAENRCSKARYAIITKVYIALNLLFSLATCLCAKPMCNLLVHVSFLVVIVMCDAAALENIVFAASVHCTAAHPSRDGVCKQMSDLLTNCNTEQMICNYSYINLL